MRGVLSLCHTSLVTMCFEILNRTRKSFDNARTTVHLSVLDASAGPIHRKIGQAASVEHPFFSPPTTIMIQGPARPFSIHISKPDKRQRQGFRSESRLSHIVGVHFQDPSPRTGEYCNDVYCIITSFKKARSSKLLCQWDRGLCWRVSGSMVLRRKSPGCRVQLGEWFLRAQQWQMLPI